MTLAELIEKAKAQGIEVMERLASGPKSTTTNETPKPSTWEYLIDSLVQAGEGSYIHLTEAISIMKARGWVTKSKSENGTYRTVHSSTYKACKDSRKGYIAQADLWVDRTKAKDGLYALLPGISEELQAKHSAWIEGKDWEQNDEQDAEE